MADPDSDGALAPRADTTGTLIVGASQAGLQLAVSLRAGGDADRIILVGAEHQPPYQRPPLSKEFLQGTATQDSLAFRTADFYDTKRIELVLGTQVVSVAPCAADGSGIARTADGTHIAFRRLALTVGAAPRLLAVPGTDLDGICYLRDLNDGLELRARLPRSRRVVIIGGGFIGLEAAAAARSMGAEVTVVEAAPRLMGRAVAPVMSEFYLHAHERRGTTVLLSSSVESFTGDHGTVTGVQLANGGVLPADLVMVGVGVIPRTELAEQLGLDCDGGIVVDEHARTSNPMVVAAGDCTVRPNPRTGEGRVRIESVQNAVAQATVAAATLLGKPERSSAVPWFWSYQGDLRLQIAGLSTGYDDLVVRGEPDSEHFTLLYYRDEQLLAADAVNSPADYMVVRTALSQGISLPADLAADSAVPLKKLLSTASQPR